MTSDTQQLRGRWADVRRAALDVAVRADNLYGSFAGAHVRADGVLVGPADTRDRLEAFDQALARLVDAVDLADETVPADV